MNTMTDNSERLSFTEVAKRIGKDRATVRRWVHRGYIQGQRYGGRTYVTAGELERFLREGNR